MKPRGDKEAEYTALCKGLERMARLYKSKEGAASAGENRKRSRAYRLIRSLCRNGLDGTIRRCRLIQSGIDRQLPTDDAGRDAPGGERNYFSSERIAVYTAEFGGYDEILEPVIQPDNIDYYVITDESVQAGSSWKGLDPSACIPKEYQGDPTLSNRWCKMHPHELFPEYRYSIYIDSNFLIVSDFTELANRMGEFPVAMFRHKNRDCVYEEVEACMLKNKAPRDALKAHAALLRAHGVPEKYGMLEAPVIARRHMEPGCVELMDRWWDAFLQGSGRDQIALIDALWALGIQPSRLSALGRSIYLCDMFIAMKHREQNKGQKK